MMIHDRELEFIEEKSKDTQSKSRSPKSKSLQKNLSKRTLPTEIANTRNT